MTEFKDTFSDINADEHLKNKVRYRMAEDKFNPEPNPKKPAKKGKMAALAAIIILAIVMAFPSYLTVNYISVNMKYDFSKARQVKSESQLSKLLNMTEKKSVSLTSGSKENSIIPPMSPDVADQEMSESPQSTNSNHSTTNVQVEGMDEGDLIKNDGQYIYRLSYNGFSIVRTNNGMLSAVCDVEIVNFAPIEMYIRDNQAVIVGGGYKNIQPYGISDLVNGGYMSCYSYHTNVEIRVFDLTDIENPVQTRYYEIEGNYHTSRISEETNKLYFVVNYYNNYYYDNYDNYNEQTTQVKRPYFRDDEEVDASPLPVNSIYYFKNIPNKSYMILGAIDLNDADKDAEIKAYLSCSNITYVSGENIYISTPQWFYNFFGNMGNEVSYISKFSLSDLSFVKSNTVKGSPKDRYCLDEYDGYLRVATNYGASAVYVFNSSMKEVSRIDNIAPGEAIDSATFSAEKGYISTSVRMMDPLFIIDFSDVNNLKISQGLKEVGISNYLKAIHGTDFVLGFGTDSAAISTGGWNDKTGLKVQLYDMSDDEAISVAKLVIEGNSSYAEVLYNPKALLYMYDEDSKTGVLGFAAECAEYSYEYGYGYGYKYTIKQQGLYFYRFDASVGTLTFIGLLSNFDTSQVISDNEYYQYDWEVAQARYSKYVERGIIIGDYIYTVSNSVVASYNLNTLEKIAELQK